MSEKIAVAIKEFHLEMKDKGITTLKALKESQYYEQYGALLLELCCAVVYKKSEETLMFRTYHRIDNDDLYQTLCLKLLGIFETAVLAFSKGENFYFWSYAASTLTNFIYDSNEKEEIKDDTAAKYTGKDVEGSGESQKTYYREISFDAPISGGSKTTLLDLYADVSAKITSGADNDSYVKFFTDCLVNVSRLGSGKVYRDRTFALLGSMMECMDEEYKVPSFKDMYEEYLKDPESLTGTYNGLVNAVSVHLKLDAKTVSLLRASSVKDLLKDRVPDSRKMLSGIFSNWKNRANETIRNIYGTSKNDISGNITLIRISGNNVTIKRAA